MTHDVFISYSSKDKPIADAICAHLEAAGIRCWIAPRDIAAGEDWPTSIAQAVSQSQALVLVFSANSNSSEEVGRELFLAANHKLVIVPFKIEDVEPEPGKQYYLARTHWLDAMNPPTREQIQSLVDCIKTLVPIKVPAIPEMQAQSAGFPGIPAPSAAVPPASGKRRGPARLWLILGLGIPLGIALVCLLGWAAFSLFSKSALAAILPFQQPSPTATLAPTATASLPPTITATLTPTAAPTIAPTIRSGATLIVPVGTKTVDFSKVYISDPFNDNSLEWPVGDVVGPWWLGTRNVENGVLNWDGTSEMAMSSHVSPGAADKQDLLSDQQVSARVNLVNQDMDGSYGLFFRGSVSETSYYIYLISGNQFTFRAISPGGSVKNLVDWQTSPYITSSGWNTMMAQAIGTHFRLFFNNHLLAEEDDDSLASGLSGIMITAFDANAKIQVQFDDFEVLLPYP